MRIAPVRGRDHLDRAVLVHAKAPLRDVDVVRAPVADHPATVFAGHAPGGEVLVPPARAEHAAVGSERARAAPAVPVQPRLHRFPGIGVRDRGIADVDAYGLDLADDAIAHQLGGDAELLHRTLHGAGLEHALVAAGRGGDGERLVDVVRQRLLAIHVLSVRHRADGDERVPVVGRGDADRVDGRILRDLPEIVDRLAVRVAIFLVDHLLRILAPGLVHVAHRNDLDAVIGEEAAHQSAALRAHPNKAHHDLVRGRRVRAPDAGGKDERRGGRRCGGLEKTTAGRSGGRAHDFG